MANLLTDLVETNRSLSLSSGGRRVLLVEDDPEAQALLARLLLSVDASLEVDCLPSFAAARRRLSRDVYDLIVADYHLADKGNGLDLWRCARHVGTRVPFVLTSGSAPLGQVPTPSESFAFLPKPLNFPLGRATLGRLLALNG